MENNVSQIDGLRNMIDNSFIGRPGLKVITVVSGKGGVGKSSISTNMAILYGMLGKRVLIMDGDLGLANINVLMGIIPRYTILDVVKGTKTVSEVIVPFNSQVDLLPGATGFYQLADISKEKQEIMIDEFLNLGIYNVIIIDAGAGISSSVISFIDVASDIVLVSTPEPTALTDAYGMIKVIASKSNKDHANLIVNMAQNNQQGLHVYQKLQSISHRFLSFSLDFLGTVPDSQDVKRSILSQKPIVVSSPNCSTTLALKSVISKLEKQDNLKIRNTTYNGVGDFFKNLFSKK